jgi:hypothetical protein
MLVETSFLHQNVLFYGYFPESIFGSDVSQGVGVFALDWWD